MFTLSPFLIKKTLRYTFFVSLFLWTIISISLAYQYIRYSSQTISSKGGTFVEGIFTNTSYLPYLRNDPQSTYYQSLLYNSCLSYEVDSEGKETYQDDLCHVSTTDNQTYTISLGKGAIWSDGTPFSLEDVFFTYNDVIASNSFSIKRLKAYKDIKITKENGTSLKVMFPSSSVDNKVFFTNFILPAHILKNNDLQYYREIYALQPTYSNCANVVSQTSDQYSLIFNLVNCKDSKLNFYQIKNLMSFDSFKQTIQEGKSSIVDAYLDNTKLPGYTQKQLLTNKIVTVFFNTKSPKLFVRARRSLGGLIKHNFYTGAYQDYLIKNTDGLFDAFVSIGDNVKEFLGRSYENTTISKQDLLDSNIKPLPTTLTIKGEGNNLVFVVDTTNKSIPLDISFDKPYDKIVMNYQGKERTLPFNIQKTTTNTNISFSSSAKTLSGGANLYEIYAIKNNKKAKILTLTLYNIIPSNTPAQQASGDIEPISIIYYKTPSHSFIANQLKTIFSGAGISSHFTFTELARPEDVEAALIADNYDMLITTIDMGIKKDMAKLFATENPKNNPSQYQNKNLISLLQQYTNTPNKKILTTINESFAKDMPFVILGKAFVPIFVKDEIATKVFGTGETAHNLYDYNRRSSIYHSLELVHNVHIDGKKIWNYTNFSLFIKDALSSFSKTSPLQESGSSTLATGSHIPLSTGTNGTSGTSVASTGSK